jgi:hypothetical protein
MKIMTCTTNKVMKLTTFYKVKFYFQQWNHIIVVSLAHNVPGNVVKSVTHKHYKHSCEEAEIKAVSWTNIDMNAKAKKE